VGRKASDKPRISKAVLISFMVSVQAVSSNGYKQTVALKEGCIDVEAISTSRNFSSLYLSSKK